MTIFMHLWARLRLNLWFIPLLMAIAAIILVWLTFLLDQPPNTEQRFFKLEFLTVSSQGARTLLATIAGSMIGIAGVSFSITIVALTLTISQFGPRLLNNFMKDWANQLVLGTFIATFIYCLLVLGTIQDSETYTFIPLVSINVSVLLALVSLGMFIFFIHHISTSMNVGDVITDVAEILEGAIDRLFPEKIGQGQKDNELLSLMNLPENFEEKAQPLYSPTSGYIQAINQSDIMTIASKHDRVIRLEHRPGDFVMTGEILAYVWPSHPIDDVLVKKVSDTFLTGNKRTDEQDVKFPIDQLVEIALRALSPSINDPNTAIDCIDRMGGCLSIFLKRAIPSPYRYDDNQKLRVIAYPVTTEEIFDIAFSRIRRHGASFFVVGFRLLEILEVLATLTNSPKVKETVRLHARMIKEETIRHLKEVEDQVKVEKRYEKIKNQLAKA